MEENLAKETSLATTTNLGGLKFKSLSEIKTWGNEIAKSGMTPLETGEKVVVAIMMGKELGLEPMVSVNNIIPINGKATLGIHLINSLLLKAGIVTEVIRSYEPCVAFAMKGDDGNVYKEFKDETDKKGTPVILRIGFADEEAKEHEVKGKTIVDYKTVVKMTRNLKQEDGSFKPMSVTASFSYSEAVQADLMKKDNWKKYTKQMCLQRATAFAGRLIGADILLGMYETSELLDAGNIPYSIEDNGKVTIINENETKSKSNEHFEEATVTPHEEVNPNNEVTE